MNHKQTYHILRTRPPIYFEWIGTVEAESTVDAIKLTDQRGSYLALTEQEYRPVIGGKRKPCTHPCYRLDEEVT